MPLSETPIPSAFFVSIKYITPMKSSFTQAAIVAVLLSGISPLAKAGATIVFDQGPLTGTSTYNGGSWSNRTDGQNFADKVSFQANTLVTGYNYFTNFDLSADNVNSAFHLKLYSDSDGKPGALLYSADLDFTSSWVEGVYDGVEGVYDGGVFNGYHFDFASQLFSADTTYWIGVSGNGFEAAQISLDNVAGGDGAMAQFAESVFDHMAGVGDQAFQLTGEAGSVPESVPDSGSMLIFLSAVLPLLVVLRRRLLKSA